jgi:hypothetical protein
MRRRAGVFRNARSGKPVVLAEESAILREKRKKYLKRKECRKWARK